MNEIVLKLMGLYYNIEQDIESIQLGLQRNLDRGNEELAKETKIEQNNMYLSRFYESSRKQTKYLNDRKEQKKDELKESIADNLKDLDAEDLM